MRRLILVKHSLPHIVPERPRREWHLSDEGLTRCSPLAVRLRAYLPERIVASPEPKAHETAHAVAAALGGIPVQTLDGLREHDDGDGPLQSEALFRAAVSEFFSRPAEAVFGPEPADDAYSRFSATITALARPSDGRSNVAVAHGRVISLLVARRNNLDPYELWGRLGLPSLVVLELPDYRAVEVVEDA